MLGAAALLLAADLAACEALLQGLPVARERLVADVLASIGEPLEGEPLAMTYELALRVEAARPVGRPRETVPRRLELLRISDVQERRISGLHDTRVPFGKVTVLAGEPKLGKSQYALLLASNLARAGERTLLVTVEDDPEDTIRPRLRALGLGCDELERIAVVRIARTEEHRSWYEVPTFPDDLDLIERALKAEQRTRMLVVDPIGAHLSERVNSWNEGAVRRALGPLQHVAQHYGVAVLAIAHLNKAIGASALYRIAGSIGLAGAARSVLFFTRDPEDPDGATRLLAHEGNVKRQQTLRYELVEILLEADDDGPPLETSRLELVGECDYTARDLGSQAGGDGGTDEATRLEEACEFLRAELTDGRRPSKDIIRRARENGISPRTLDRARAELGVEAAREGFGDEGRWYLGLPIAQRPSTPVEGALWRCPQEPPNHAGFGAVEESESATERHISDMAVFAVDEAEVERLAELARRWQRE
jgi:hypothetical protein